MGTTDRKTNLLHYSYNQIKNNNSTLTVFFNLKKAFDKIDHDILIAKLLGMGLRGNCILLIKNYLSNRTQRCKANNTLSNSKTITCGVPQSSTIGPLLFIVYINDVVNYIQETETSLYADDTAFFTKLKSIPIANQTMSNACNQFQQWCNMNKLTLNLAKCKVIIISNSTGKKLKEIKHDIKVKIGNYQLELVNEFKYLGITIDENLRFNSHIKCIKSLVLSKTRILQKVWWLLGK